MKLSKAEIGMYAAGGLSLIGGLIAYFAQRNKAAQDRYYTPLFIMGGGLALTGGVLSIHRKVTQPKALGSGLGLAEVETVRKGDMTLRKWGDPEMSVAQRVHLLQGLVATSNKDPLVRKKALEVTHKCLARDDECEAKAIFDYVADPKNVRYTGDMGAHVLVPGGKPEAVDTFQSAKRTLEFKGGDCDDHAVLTASLANWNGFPAKFRITSNTGETWDHIYTMVGVPKLDPKRWIALDTTLGEGKFNKHPKQAKHVEFDA